MLRMLVCALVATHCVAFSLAPGHRLLQKSSAKLARTCLALAPQFRPVSHALLKVKSKNSDYVEEGLQEDEISHDSFSSDIPDIPQDYSYHPKSRRPFDEDPNDIRAEAFLTLPHDVICIADSNLLVYYHNGMVNGWKQWVDEHYRQGRRVYALDFSAKVVSGYGWTIPECFQVLKYQPIISEQKLEKVLQDVVSAFDVNCDRLAWRLGALQLDLQEIAVAGYIFDHAEPSQFTEADRTSSGVVFMSPIYSVMKWYLGSKKDHKKWREVIRANDFGRLIPCRYIRNGGWEDLV